jgi:hypothetical protein
MHFARRIWIAAVCTLGLLVSATAVQAQATKLLPSDTEMVVTLNLQQILKSDALKGDVAKTLVDIVKAKINQGLEDKGVDKHLKKAGFDMFADLSSITFAMPGGRASEESFIVLEGNFDADKIEEAANAAAKEAGGGFKIITIANVKAFEVSPKEEKTMYVGILNKKTMIACATKADFTEAVARFNGTKKASFKSDAVKTLLETVNNKQSLSMVATSTVLAKLAENAPQGGGDQAKQALELMKTMEGFTMALTVQKNIDFQAGANTKDAKTAGEYAGLVNLFINGAKAKVAEQAKNNNDEKSKLAADILNTVRATTQGNNLMIRGQITFENLEKLLKNVPLPNN